MVLKIWSFFPKNSTELFKFTALFKKLKIEMKIIYTLQKFAKENVAPDHFKSPIKLSYLCKNQHRNILQKSSQ